MPYCIRRQPSSDNRDIRVDIARAAKRPGFIDVSNFPHTGEAIRVPLHWDDMISVGGLYIVSEKLKDLFFELCPDQVVLHHIDVLFTDGERRSSIDYYILKLKRVVDCLDFEQSIGDLSEGAGERKVLSRPGKIVLKPDTSDNLAIWHPEGMESAIFVSDGLACAMQDAKISPLLYEELHFAVSEPTQ